MKDPIQIRILGRRVQFVWWGFGRDLARLRLIPDRYTYPEIPMDVPGRPSYFFRGYDFGLLELRIFAPFWGEPDPAISLPEAAIADEGIGGFRPIRRWFLRRRRERRWRGYDLGRWQDQAADQVLGDQPADLSDYEY
jgi:hypothetical protein